MKSIRNLLMITAFALISIQTGAKNYAITFEYPIDGEYAKRIIGTVGGKLQKLNKKSLTENEQKFVNKRIGVKKTLPTWTDYVSTDLTTDQIKQQIGYLGMDKLKILEIKAD